ncbi:outer membrane beta-barrel protein [Aureimonas mangrovi]|uniref:outer membrane beta-barrel protein n=1 Tax=Aureimonas mangrovi TaxID=2758041 RepID=UPI00163DBC42|nr:outer membrane beta-barrel protein [Aureimonas mangrovi]
MAKRARNAGFLLALALASGPALAQLNAPLSTNDVDTDGELRLETLDANDLGNANQSLQDPFIPDAPGDPASPALPETRSTPREPEAPLAGEPALDFDLFDGPDELPRSQRQNLPIDGAEPIDREVDAQVPATARDLAVFRATGPVRSPTFAPAAREDRLNPAAMGLRPSIPLGEEDPFAPDGLRAGRFLLFPVLEQEVGVSDNLDAAPDSQSGAFTETRLSARLLSDWSRHEAQINATAAYRRNFGGEAEEDPRLGLDGQMRIDINRELTALLRGAVSYAREDPILADPLLNVEDRPDVLTYSFGAELRREAGRSSLAFTGDIVREERDVDGITSGTDDFSTASLGLRAGFDISPALQPFVAASIGSRFFDEDSPITGGNRDSRIPALRGGVAFDFGEKLSGEAAIGYAWNVPEDDGLPTIGAPTFDVALNWSPRRGTDLALTAATFFDPDSSSLSTSTVYETALALQHRVTTRTLLNGRLSAAFRNREGAGSIDDTTYAAQVGLEHWLNRTMALTALARHELLESDFAPAEYTANSVRVGVRFQR